MFLPPQIFHIFEQRYDGCILFEQNDDIMTEVVDYIAILDENFVPDILSNLYINIPVAILDYKELIADN
jgi:hypothetical protein